MLRDTDSISIKFIFSYHHECSILEKDAGKLMFEVTLGSKVFERLDRSHEYFEILQARDKEIEKQIGIYEFETIDKPIMNSGNVNLKEYYKHYSNKDTNTVSKSWLT